MKKDGQKEILKQVLRYIRPYRVLVVFSLLAAVVSVALTLYIPVLTGQVIDHIIGRGKVDFDAVFSVMRRMIAVILRRRSGS